MGRDGLEPPKVLQPFDLQSNAIATLPTTLNFKEQIAGAGFEPAIESL